MMSDCEIVKVDNQETQLPPKIVTFQNGQPSNTNKFQCRSYINTNNAERILAIASDRLTYVGEESENDLFYTLLAIRNKKTNKVRIVPCSTVSMSVSMNKTNILLDSTLDSSIMNIGTLYKQFGSKKKKRQTEQTERMKMNVSHVEEELKSSVKNIIVKEDELTTRAVNEEKTEYRPHINRGASRLEDVYDLYSMIQQDELDSLKDLADNVINKSVINEQLSIFILDCVNKLKQSSIIDTKKIEILLYCDAILKFFQKSSIEAVRKSVKIAPYPEKIVHKILKDFTVFSDNSRHRPLTMRDKAVCYVLVLALIAMDFKVDLESLAKSVKVGIKKLSDISRILGAQFVSGNKNNIILKLPLPPQVTGFRKVGKKKL